MQHDVHDASDTHVCTHCLSKPEGLSTHSGLLSQLFMLAGRSCRKAWQSSRWARTQGTVFGRRRSRMKWGRICLQAQLRSAMFFSFLVVPICLASVNYCKFMLVPAEFNDIQWSFTMITFLVAPLQARERRERQMRAQVPLSNVALPYLPGWLRWFEATGQGDAPAAQVSYGRGHQEIDLCNLDQFRCIFWIFLVSSHCISDNSEHVLPHGVLSFYQAEVAAQRRWHWALVPCRCVSIRSAMGWHLGPGLQPEATSSGRKHWACPASSDHALITLHLVKCWSMVELWGPFCQDHFPEIEAACLHTLKCVWRQLRRSRSKKLINGNEHV